MRRQPLGDMSNLGAINNRDQQGKVTLLGQSACMHPHAVPWSLQGVQHSAAMICISLQAARLGLNRSCMGGGRGHAIDHLSDTH